MTISVRTVALHATFLMAAVFPAAAQSTSEAVVSACHVSPIVSDLEKSARFYHDLLGMDLMPAPPPGPLPWDTDPGHLLLHGLPDARLRFIQARMPGVRCGIELVEFANVDRTPVRRRYQDPGAATIILMVRDIDLAFAALRKGGAHVVTTSGGPISMNPANKTRAVIVQDPDGHYVELAQVDPLPQTRVAAESNVIGIRLRLTVADVEQALAYYQHVLGVQGTARPFVRGPSVMDMAGLPAAGEYQLATIQMPGSSLVFELIGFKGLDSAKTPVASRVQDPGSFRLQLTMGSIDAALATLKESGARVISTGGVPVSMTFGGRPWRLSVVPDANNLFLIVQQAPAPVEPASAFFTTSDGVKIRYLTLGDRGSWVVLIHGYSDSAQRMWFTTGIAPVLARNHRVVALDNRNHGESGKPQPGGPGRAQDIVELMDHLKIDRAHIHGYSMGGALAGQLLALIPGRFITAGFGGSGLQETDPALRAQAAALDEAAPKAQGADAAAMERFRARVAASLPAGSTTPASPAMPAVDLRALAIPIIGINGAYDSPYAKTHRFWREASVFQNVILPGKTHLTAVAVGGPMPPEYADAMSRFIDEFDAR
jgi:pimeloyl-ACP methyl ester carboxylesterase/catechol 2,3-dioxygenase-like lactoylglutathione lyase family enzyme